MTETGFGRKSLQGAGSPTASPAALPTTPVAQSTSQVRIPLHPVLKASCNNNTFTSRARFSVKFEDNGT